MGKSTILRAILFFNKPIRNGLESGREEIVSGLLFPLCRFLDHLRVAREDGWFTVLSYKTMNRICYRFIASYRPDLFIDEEGAPYPSDVSARCSIRTVSSIAKAISTYEEYRNILYGNSDNKQDYSCCSLMEAASYQNIIRTIGTSC